MDDLRWDGGKWEGEGVIDSRWMDGYNRYEMEWID
jgi:hypothetical protein